MADVLGKLRARLEADSSGFTAGIAKATKSLKGFGDFAKGSLDRIKGGFTGLAAGIAGAGIGAAIKGQVDELAKIGQLSKRYGESTRNLQILQYAANKVGLTLDEVADSTKDLFNNLAANPDAFGRLGLSADALIGKDLVTQLGTIGDAMRGLASDEERASVAMATMGESGLKLLPLLTQGVAGLAEQARELEAMGGIVSDGDIDKMTKLSQEITKAHAQYKMLVTEAALAAAPAAEGMSWLAQGIRWTQENIGQPLGRAAWSGIEAASWLGRRDDGTVIRRAEGLNASHPYKEYAEFRRNREATERIADNMTAPTW